MAKYLYPAIIVNYQLLILEEMRQNFNNLLYHKCHSLIAYCWSRILSDYLSMKSWICPDVQLAKMLHIMLKFIFHSFNIHLVNYVLKNWLPASSNYVSEPSSSPILRKRGVALTPLLGVFPQRVYSRMIMEMMTIYLQVYLIF